MNDIRREAIERFLRTGESDPVFAAWPGDVITAARAGTEDLKQALVEEVARRARRGTMPAGVPDLELEAFARDRVDPMVRGLFPAHEQGAVIDLLGRSVVLLTPENIGDVIRQADWLHTAWSLANLYLGSLGAELLSDDAPRIVGLSEDTTCYVSLEYFRRSDRFEDFVVHEAAHVFHNCKRRTAGLVDTRRREWLLEIEFRRRETFAYACEALSRVLVLGRNRGEREKLVEEIARGRPPNDATVDPREYVEILREAVAARNGWRRILARCAPRQDPRLAADGGATTMSARIAINRRGMRQGMRQRIEGDGKCPCCGR